MIMIRCHLSDFVEFIKDDLRRSSDSSPERKLIENAAQKYYDHAVSELMMLHKFQYYAKYSRRLTILDQDIRLTIKRVYRKDCHADAVLLSFMVPYSNRTVNDFLAILAEDHIQSFTVPDTGNSFGYDAVRLIRWKFRQSWQKILSANQIALDLNITTACFSLLGRQFLQNRKLRSQLVFT